MLKKYLVVLTVFVATVLLLIATMVYPGGSKFDKNSIGFDCPILYNQFISRKGGKWFGNLSRLWAVFGMFFLASYFE